MNALLLVALGISLTRHRETASVAAPEPLSSSLNQSTLPFRWNQLESTDDYRSYVANLRAIGCPESTIRAIVTADFEAAAQFEKRQLQLAGPHSDVISLPATEQAILRALGTNEISSSAGETETAASSTSILRERLAKERFGGQTAARASYPIVFQNAVQNDSSLTENQKAAVRQLQQQFVDALGGAGRNPADPAYRARWQTAQQDADEALRAQLGNQAYNNYKLQHYYSNFQQVMLSAPDGGVTINPEELAR